MWTVFVWFTVGPSGGSYKHLRSIVVLKKRGISIRAGDNYRGCGFNWLDLQSCWNIDIAQWPDIDAGVVSSMYDVRNIAAECLYLSPASDLPSGIA
jgi:hypothetical protein